MRSTSKGVLRGPCRLCSETCSHSLAFHGICSRIHRRPHRSYSPIRLRPAFFQDIVSGRSQENVLRLQRRAKGKSFPLLPLATYLNDRLQGRRYRENLRPRHVSLLETVDVCLGSPANLRDQDQPPCTEEVRAKQKKPKLHARNLMGWGEDRPSWAWAPAARCTTTVLLERPFEETSRSASGSRTSSELGVCTPCGTAPHSAR